MTEEDKRFEERERPTKRTALHGGKLNFSHDETPPPRRPPAKKELRRGAARV
jgi:hypothetical protein